MKKGLLCILLIAGLSVPAAWAQINIQQITQTEEFDKGSIITSEDDVFGVFLNSPFLGNIQQLAIDANQVARITIEGSNNDATLTQSGQSNIGIINITGNNNIAGLTQNGSDLFSAINIDGFSNELDVSQTGNDLQNLILLQGSGLNFDIVQNTSGVQLTQRGSSIPLQIQHTGSIIPIIIRNN